MGSATRMTLRTADVGQSYYRGSDRARVRAATRSLVRAALVALVALVGVATATPAASHGAATNPEFFGTNFSTLDRIDRANRPALFQMLSRSRMTINRIDARWADVEPVPTEGGSATYQWGRMDELIGAMAQQGLRASPSFRFPPTWAGGGVPNRVLPDRYDDYGRMVAAFARRYGPTFTRDGRLEGGEFWRSRPDLPARPVLTYELWNEINLDDYAWSTDANETGNADPAAYAAMLEKAQPIIKAALPSAIILGSLSWKDRPEEAGTDAMVPFYVSKLGANGGLALLDGMGFHPYAPDAQATLDLVVRLRGQLTAAGFPQMPIYADEAGQEAVTVHPTTGAVSPTNRAATKWAHELFPTDAARGANLAFAGEALAASDCGVAQFLPYGVSGPFESIYAPGITKSSLPRTEAWMGLYYDVTGEPTLSALALQRAATRWAQRFDAGGPGAPASLALCGGGESPAASKLPITGVFTGLPDGCAKVVTTYDGNPLEAAYLRFYDPATGQQVAEARTDTHGEAQQCVPWELKGKPFRVVANLGQAGITGVVECDIPGVGCPAGVELRPGSGTLSARAVTGWVAPPTPAAPACTYKLALTPGKFTKDKRGPRGRQRLTASVTCSTAAPGAKLRFEVRRRAAKGGKERRVKRVWLTVGKPRVLGVPAVKKGERVVVVHLADPKVRAPRLRQSLPVAAKVRPPVNRRR